MAKPYNLDSDLRNADWLRTRRWDLPTNPEVFLTVIGGREALAHFMTLPAAEAMPEELKAALFPAQKVRRRIRRG